MHTPSKNLNLDNQHIPNLNAPARKFIAQYGLLLILFVIMLGFSLIRPAFWSLNNQINIIFASSLIGIMAVCSTLVVITGGIDLSVSSTVALSGLIAALTLESSGGSIVAALSAGIISSAVVGIVNG